MHVDLARALAIDLEEELEFVRLDVNATRHQLSERAIDLGFVVSSPAGLPSLADSGLVHTQFFEFFGAASGANVSHGSDLEGSTVAVVANSVARALLTERDDYGVPVEYPNELEAPTSVADGVHDYALVSLAGGRSACEDLARRAELRRLSTNFLQVSYALACAPGREDLLERAKNELANYRRTGWLQERTEHWTPRESRMDPRGGSDVGTVTLGLVLLGSLLLVTLTWTRSLRSQVGERTRALSREAELRRAALAGLARRDAILRAVGHSAEQLLSSAAWRPSVPTVLERLGPAAEAGRATWLERQRSDLRPELVWTSASPTARAAEEHDARFWRQLGPEHAAELGRGEVLRIEGRSASEAAAEALAELGMSSVLVLPVNIDGRLAGAIALAAREERVPWSSAEVDALRAASGSLGAAMRRANHEQALFESEQRYRLMADHATDLISRHGLDGGFRYASPASRALLGCDPTDLLGKRLESLAHENDRDEVRMGFDRLAAGADRSVWTYRARNGSGGYSWFETTARAVTPDTDETDALEVVAVTRDITERRRLEESLLQGRKMEAIGRLAGGVAHDFNNLLTAILGYAELARDEIPAGHPAASRVLEIAQAAERAAQLTQQLLAFARRQAIEPRRLDLNDLVLGTERILRRLIGEHVEIVIETAPNLHRVRLDPAQFEQILINLAINARDAMPDGGTLTIETRSIEFGPQDPPSSRQPGTYARLSVHDTGTGMDADTLRNAFEPFFTTKAVGKGTGLGLATSYGIVSQAGGHIEVESEVGRGTTVHVDLPIDSSSAPAPALPALRVPATPGRETVLLVEDEAAVRAIAREALEGRGYRVLEADGPEQALRIARSCEDVVDLLLTDVVMPERSGLELATEILAMLPRIRVLYMSGYNEAIDAEAAGVQQLLAKPFAPSELATRVREVLDAEDGAPYSRP